MIKKLIQRVPHYLKVFKKLSSNDFLLISYPKSGNTWIRYIIANYIGISDLKKETITFSELDEIMPGLGKENFFNPWEYTVPKFSATHFKYIFLFQKTSNIYIVRDPRDVMVSYFFYLNKKDNQINFDNLIDIMKHPKYGLDAWFKHIYSWRNNIDFLMVYEELLYNDEDILLDMFYNLDINFNQKTLTKAVQKSRFKNFKNVEKKFGHSKPWDNKEDFKFVRKGKSGDFKNYFDDECYEYYDLILSKYNYKSYNEIINDIRPDF